MSELIWEVDENDQPIGPIERAKSREVGARYRMARISVEDKDGNILLQKRNPDKKSYPNCWDTSVGGNVSYRESYEQAARREALEEIGLTVDNLEEIAHFYGEVVDPSGKKMNRFTKLFRTIVSPDTKFEMQEDEVSEIRWVTKQQLIELARQEGASDGLQSVIDNYYLLS